MIFADDAGHAHARRWTNRQSGRSEIRPETHVVLIVSEAMHDTGPHDVNALREEPRQALPLFRAVRARPIAHLSRQIAALRT